MLQLLSSPSARDQNPGWKHLARLAQVQVAAPRAHLVLPCAWPAPVCTCLWHEGGLDPICR